MDEVDPVLLEEIEIMSRKLPDNLPIERPCRLCDQMLHLLKLNDRVAFYVHRGDELKVCKAISPKTSFMNALRDLRRAGKIPGGDVDESS